MNEKRGYVIDINKFNINFVKFIPSIGNFFEGQKRTQGNVYKIAVRSLLIYEAVYLKVL